MLQHRDRTIWQSYAGPMASTTSSFRTDQGVEAAIERLRALAEPGASRSDVIRQAILDADKAAERAELRRWAEEIMADPEQVAETRRANAYMDSIRAW